jgi:hypothetical protein
MNNKYHPGEISKRHKGAGLIGMGRSEFRTGGNPPPKPLSAKAVRAKNNWLGKKARKIAKATMAFALRSKVAKRKKCGPS